MATYDARNDGSTESDVLVINQTPFEAVQTMTRPDGETVERKIVQQTCLDGCGGVPTGKKSRFIQGHDATLKGRLIRAHINNIPVRIIRGDESTDWTALDYAAELGWDHFLVDAEQRNADKAARAEERKADLERLKQEREAKKAAAVKTDDEFPFEITLFGRMFPAKVLSEEDDGTVVWEYRKKDGSTNTYIQKPEPVPAGVVVTSPNDAPVEATAAEVPDAG